MKNKTSTATRDEQDAQAFDDYMRGRLNDPVWLVARLQVVVDRLVADGRRHGETPIVKTGA